MRWQARWIGRIALVGAALAASAPVGCGKEAPAEEPAPLEKLGAKRLGANCKATAECRPGLTCLYGTCAPENATAAPRELERAYELGGQRTDEAIHRYDPSRRRE